jgi:hypothetical protein
LLAVVATAVAFAAITGLAGAATQRTAHASVAQRVIQIEGRPFFPIMLIDQCSASDADHARSLGINLILNESCPNSASQQLSNLSRRQLGVLEIKHRQARGANLVGWTFPDEPDNNGWTPARLAKTYPYRRGSPDGLLSFLTTSGRFFHGPYRDPKLSPATIGQFARLADVAGFDLYPLNACQHDLSAVYDAQRDFTRLAGGMPTFQWIETGPIRSDYCGGFSMTPDELTAEAWLAVTGGARAIGFFTHTWSPDHKAFDVTPDVQAAMAGFSRLANEAAPGLLGRTILSGANSPAIKVLARRSNGRTYVFAVNSIVGHVAVTIHVPRLHGRVLDVLDEKRQVGVKKGRFVDVFPPYGVHVYVQENPR